MKKIIQIILLLFLCLRITYSQNGVVKSYFPNGVVQSETSYVNDVLDGAAITYFQDGKIATEKNFSQGVLDGFVREYYETGKLKLEYSVKNGIKDGAYRVFNKDGILTELRNYNLGELAKKEIFASLKEAASQEKYELSQKETTKGANKKAESDLEKKNENPVSVKEIIPAESQKKTAEIKKEETELLSKVKTDTEPAVKSTEKEEEILCDVQECPVPIGGMKAIQLNLIYPEHALLYRIEGAVIIIATINPDGKVIRTQVLKGLGYGCDEEAQIAVRKTKFTPGKQNGVAAETNATITIQFKITGKK